MAPPNSAPGPHLPLPFPLVASSLRRCPSCIRRFDGLEELAGVVHGVAIGVVVVVDEDGSAGLEPAANAVGIVRDLLGSVAAAVVAARTVSAHVHEGGVVRFGESRFQVRPLLITEFAKYKREPAAPVWFGRQMGGYGIKYSSAASPEYSK